MDELIQEFLVEGNENLDRFDGDLVKLEAEPANKELLSGNISQHSLDQRCVRILGIPEAGKVGACRGEPA